MMTRLEVVNFLAGRLLVFDGMDIDLCLRASNRFIRSIACLRMSADGQ